MKLRNFKGFFDEFEEGQGGGGASEGAVAVFEDEGSEEQEGVQTEEGEGTVVQTEAQPQQPSFTYDQVVGLMQNQPQQQQQAPEPKMTQDEIDAALHTVRVTPELAQALFGEDAGDAQVVALQQFADSITKHNTTLGGYSQQAMMQQVNQQISPALDMATQQRETQFAADLTGAYPALKGQEKVVSMVMQQLRQQGYTAPDGATAARVVAGQAETWLKTVNPAFSLSSQSSQGQQQQGGMPGMAELNGGSGGGGSGGSSKQGTKKSWDGLFD